MDIGNGKGPALSQLSTMANHVFVIDNVLCTSIESFIQALKFDKASLAASIAADKPKNAKERGKKNFNWAQGGNVFWKGMPMERDSSQYRSFLEHVVKEVARQCPAFGKALVDTGELVLTSPGRTRESESPVTEAEYCRVLTRARTILLERAKHALAKAA